MAAVTVSFAVLAAGCGHSAVVELKDDNFVEGRITHSDAQHLYVDQDEGGPVSLYRDNIIDIDHPGTVLQVAGALIALIGVANAHGSSLGTNAIVFAVIGGPGLAMLGWGTWANLGSRKAAEKLTREQDRLWNSRPYLPAPHDTIPLFPPAGSPDPLAK
jgi:hypothetical protein